jgi:hypothetical protein
MMMRFYEKLIMRPEETDTLRIHWFRPLEAAMLKMLSEPSSKYWLP